MGGVRASVTLVLFLLLTLPLMPAQAVLLWLAPRWARRLPHWYHRQVCHLLGLHIRVTGAVQPAPLLIVANHSSWLDIPVLSSCAPLVFIAKSEVAGWPFIGTLARLQRTIFIDRSMRGDAHRQAKAVAARLAAGETVVLFAEGTTSDGNRVLPFKSALFAAALGCQDKTGITVQTVAIVYTRLHGLPLGRPLRPHIAWYGDMDVIGHAWTLLGLGPIDVELRIGPPLSVDGLDRKTLARTAEAQIRTDVQTLLRGVAGQRRA